MESNIDMSKSKTAYAFTVGVLIDSVDSYFNHRTICDLIDAAEEKNIHLVFFFGGSLSGDQDRGQFSFAYSLPDKATIQALIVFPHSIAPYDTRSTVRLVLEQYQDIPVYSFFEDLQPYYSIWPETESAIESMISHLVEDHHYRRFALLMGPDAAQSLSRRRKEKIESILTGYNITIEPHSIYTGTFSARDGKNTAEQILTHPADAPDVLICMNDQMAIGAVKEFLHNGIAIPEDLAIVGFDDVEENSSLPCSLTSINFPVWEMVTSLIERISSDLEGTTLYQNDKIRFQAEFMHRESCGCTSWFEKKTRKNESFIPLDQSRSSHGNLKKAAVLRRSLEEIIEECLSTADNSLFTSFMESTIKNLSRSGDLTSSFIDTFSTQWTVTLLKHQDFGTQVTINSLFVDAFRMLIQTRLNSFSRVHSNDLGSLDFYQKSNELLSEKLSLPDAVRGIGSNIPLLGISRCILVFIDQDEPENGEVRLVYKEGSVTEYFPAKTVRFPLKNLLDTGVSSFHEPVGILTIASTQTVFGYLVLTISDKHFDQFAMMQKMVSGIIAAAMSNESISCRLQTLTQKNDALSRLSVIDEFTGLYNRRALYVTGRNMYQQAVSGHESSCFIFLDMDGLKKINDTYGHLDGDMAIKALANILKNSFREKDLVIRYGGDEFIVLMTNIQATVVERAFERISQQLSAFNEKKEYPWTLSVSWGHIFNEGTGLPKNFESMIEESDAKLYEQKRKKKEKQQLSDQ